MASEGVPTLAMSNCSLGFDKPKLIQGEMQANVLEEVCKYLGVFELLQVRSICRHWKETVDGCPELMERVSINFPEKLVFDRNYKPVTLVPARNARFTKSRISSIDLWWPSIGHRLVHLTVKDCQMSFSMLLKILKHTSELKCLEYLCSSYHAAVVSDFGNLKLQKLERLAIDVPNEDILDIVIELRNLFPNLKKLRVLKEITVEELIVRQDTLGDILEGIHLKSADKLLDGSLLMKGIKCLKISKITTNDMLSKIGEAFPELNSLAVNTQHEITMNPTFLNNMENMENLTVRGRQVTEKDMHIDDIDYYNNWTKIDFSRVRNQYVRQLCLIGIEPKPFTLHHYLKSSTGVRNLTFRFCWFESWSEIFTLSEKFAFLEQIELISIHVKKQDINLCEYFDNLKILKIEYCTLSEALLIIFFSLCPQLKEIYLKSVKGITDNVIGNMIKSTTKLQKLVVNECSITDTAIEYIANSGLLLKHVAIEKCGQVSAVALDKIKLVKNK